MKWGLCFRLRPEKTIEDYRTELLTYLFESETKQKKLKIPFKKLGFNSDTDFVEAIPVYMIEPYISSQKITLSPEVEKGFKKKDLIVWKPSNGNFTHRATFRQHNSNLQAKIRLEDKSKRCINVPKSEITHYKDFLKSFLPHSAKPGRVTIIESYQERSVDVPKPPTHQRKMENTSPKNGYEIGKVVYNTSTKQHAIIEEHRLADSVGVDRQLRISVIYRIVTVLNNEIKEIHPSRGGSSPLGDFMMEWEPFNIPGSRALEQPESLRTVNDEEYMETDEVLAKTENIKSFSTPSTKYDNRNAINRATVKMEPRYREEGKISGKERTKRERIENTPYNTKKNSSRRTKNETSDLKKIKRSAPSEEFDAEIHPSSSSDQMRHRNCEENNVNIIHTADIANLNSKNSRETQNSTETQKSTERQRFTERSKITEVEEKNRNTKNSRGTQNSTERSKIIEVEENRNTKNSRETQNSTERSKITEVEENRNAKNFGERQNSTERSKITEVEENRYTKNSRERQNTTERSKITEVAENRNAIPPNIVHLNRKISRDRKSSTETRNNVQTIEHRKSHEEQITSNEDETKRNLEQNHKNITTDHNKPAKYFPPSSDGHNDRWDWDNSGNILPKIKQTTKNLPLDNNIQKLTHIQKTLQNHEIIPAHRKFSTPPGFFVESHLVHINHNIGTETETKGIEAKIAAKEMPSTSIPPKSEDYVSPIKKQEKESINSQKLQISHSKPYSKFGGKQSGNLDPSSFTQSFDMEKICGSKKGIHGRNNSCYLDATIFSLYYCTNIFDKITLDDKEEDDKMAQEIKRILRDRIVRPLRQNNYCSYESINDLRFAMAPLSKKINGSFMDAEEFIFLLFENAMKLKEFIKYSSDAEDFMHQIVPNPADREKCQTVQVLFQNSLKYLGDMKFADIPNPALILEMPRSDGKLVQYEAIIPNLSLDISGIMETNVNQDHKYCKACENAATFECAACKVSNGKDAIAYCQSCKDWARLFHETIDHKLELVDIHRKSLTMDLMAVICIRAHHYVTFVRNGVHQNSPWLFFDSMAGAYPEVSHVENMGEILEVLQTRPNMYRNLMKTNHYMRRLLTDSHICIYHSHSVPSSE